MSSRNSNSRERSVARVALPVALTSLFIGVAAGMVAMRLWMKKRSSSTLLTTPLASGPNFIDARNDDDLPFVHRNATCSLCQRDPIVGCRYKCLNCPAFDLCSACEKTALKTHDRTHVFAKIKVPAPSVPRKPLLPNLLYPGKSFIYNDV